MKQDSSPQKALSRYKRDGAVAGHHTVVVAISMPVEDLAAVDEMCERLRMSRSHLLRKAAKEYGVQQRLWREALK